jgi:hypothetical protein
MPINEDMHAGQMGDSDKVEETNPPIGGDGTLLDNRGSDKFPKWDIVPPHQFINPRIRRTQ